MALRVLVRNAHVAQVDDVEAVRALLILEEHGLARIDLHELHVLAVLEELDGQLACRIVESGEELALLQEVVQRTLAVNSRQDARSQALLESMWSMFRFTGLRIFAFKAGFQRRRIRAWWVKHAISPRM